MKRQLSTAVEVTRNVFRTQVFTEKINKSTVPVFISDKNDARRCVVNDKPVHPGGKKMINPYQYGGYFLECHGGASKMFEYARLLLTL